MAEAYPWAGGARGEGGRAPRGEGVHAPRGEGGHAARGGVASLAASPAAAAYLGGTSLAL